jgi:hypothetical protein
MLSGNLSVGGVPLSGGSNASWVTANGSTYSGGFIASVNNVAKSIYYYDNVRNNGVIFNPATVGFDLFVNNSGSPAINVAVGNIVNLSSRLNVNGATDNASYALNVNGAANFSGALTGTSATFTTGSSNTQLTVNGTGSIKSGINFASGGTTYGQIYFDNNAPYSMSVLQQYSTGSLILGTNNTANLTIANGGVVSTTSRLNVNGAADNSLFSLNNGGGTTYTNGFSPNASNYTGAITLGGGTTYVYTGSGAVTWTLPTPSGNNQIYIIKNNGSGAITLNSYAANQLITLASATASSIIISIGETVTIQQDGSSKSYIVNVGGGSGTYTPTITNISNVSSSSIPYTCYYSKVGNIVTVSGIIDVTPTATTTSTSLRLSFPIDIGTASASKFISGVATSVNNGAVVGVFSGGYLYPTLVYVSTGTVMNEFNFTFTYEVQ